MRVCVGCQVIDRQTEKKGRIEFGDDDFGEKKRDIEEGDVFEWFDRVCVRMCVCVMKAVKRARTNAVSGE